MSEKFEVVAEEKVRTRESKFVTIQLLKKSNSDWGITTSNRKNPTFGMHSQSAIYNYEFLIQSYRGVKLHERNYAYKFQEKNLSDVKLEKIQKLATKLSTTKPISPLVKDNGRMILAFLTAGYYEEFSINIGNEEEPWYEYGDARSFTFSTETENYNIVVAEFWTESKFDHEQAKDFESAYNFHHDIKEDTGNYSIYDVYSQKELGL